MLIYLTIHGDPPSSKSTSCKSCNKKVFHCDGKQELEKSDYSILSFKELLEWIKRLYKTEANSTPFSGIIEQYKNILENVFKMSEVVSKIIRKETTYFAAEKIESAMNEARTTIRNNFFDDLKNIACNELAEQYNLDEDIKNLCLTFDKNTQFVFKKKDSSRYIMVSYESNIYCYRGCSDSAEKQPTEWTYITNDWFDKVIDKIGVGTQKVTDAVNGKSLSGEKNKILQWYFSSEENQRKQLKNIVLNIKNYGEN